MIKVEEYWLNGSIGCILQKIGRSPTLRSVGSQTWNSYICCIWSAYLVSLFILVPFLCSEISLFKCSGHKIFKPASYTIEPMYSRCIQFKYTCIEVTFNFEQFRFRCMSWIFRRCSQSGNLLLKDIFKRFRQLQDALSQVEWDIVILSYVLLILLSDSVTTPRVRKNY